MNSVILIRVTTSSFFSHRRSPFLIFPLSFFNKLHLKTALRRCLAPCALDASSPLINGEPFGPGLPLYPLSLSPWASNSRILDIVTLLKIVRVNVFSSCLFPSSPPGFLLRHHFSLVISCSVSPHLLLPRTDSLLQHCPQRRRCLSSPSSRSPLRTSSLSSLLFHWLNSSCSSPSHVPFLVAVVARARVRRRRRHLGPLHRPRRRAPSLFSSLFHFYLPLPLFTLSPLFLAHVLLIFFCRALGAPPRLDRCVRFE